MVLHPILVDQLAFILFVVFFVGYHVFYLVVMRHHPQWSVRARMHAHRKNWIESNLRRGERIMAVQSLRNLIMTNTFMASTMILLVAFTSNYFVLNQPPERLFDVGQGNPWFHGAVPVPVKGAVLLVLYAFAFVMFLTTLRTLNHLSILVGVEPDHLQQVEHRNPAEFLTSKLNETESMTTYGRRAVYFSLAVFAWFFSPWLFAAFTLGIWFFFIYWMDFVQHPEAPTPEASSSTSSAAVSVPK